jgi:predicted acylesterase/phospholipase RssA
MLAFTDPAFPACSIAVLRPSATDTRRPAPPVRTAAAELARIASPGPAIGPGRAGGPLRRMPPGEAGRIGAGFVGPDTDEHGGLSVRDLIVRRRRGEHDGATFVIAVEGGGMRGVVSGGMLIALSELGITHLADHIVGVSAGALNVAYHAAGYSWEALACYYQRLPAGLIRPRRQWLRHRLLDMDYLDELFATIVPLPGSIVDGKVPAYATVTDVAAHATRLVDLGAPGTDAHAWLKAGAWVPVLSGPPPWIGARQMIDGAILCPDPATAAGLLDATHILAVHSSPPHQGRPARTARLLRPLLNGWSDGLGDLHLRRWHDWQATKKTVTAGADVRGHGARVLRLAPGDHRVGRLTRDPARLMHGAYAGYVQVWQGFTDQPCHLRICPPRPTPPHDETGIA